MARGISRQRHTYMPEGSRHAMRSRPPLLGIYHGDTRSPRLHQHGWRLNTLVQRYPSLPLTKLIWTSYPIFALSYHSQSCYGRQPMIILGTLEAGMLTAKPRPW